jgi:hypothetical protein
LVGLSLSVVPAANTAEQNPDAHVHGVSALNLAIDGSFVEAELVSPGADIVGFEGRPVTEAERTAVKRAVGILRAGDTVLGLPEAARCIFAGAEVESGLMDAASETRDTQDHDHAHATHAEFRAHYRLECAAPDRLTHIEFRAFQQFPSMREVEVRAITPGGQRAADLTPQSPRLDF